jgi:hypothetical protein
MSPDQGFEERQRERQVRGRAFRLAFAAFALILGRFLIWKLSNRHDRSGSCSSRVRYSRE